MVNEHYVKVSAALAQHRYHLPVSSGLQAAIDAAGSQAELGRVLGVTPPAISGWVQAGYVPPPRALQIEALYNIPRRTLLDPALLRLCGCDAVGV